MKTQVHLGKDEMVRASTVRTAYSEFERPIVRLILLERVELVNVKLLQLFLTWNYRLLSIVFIDKSVIDIYY